MRANAAATLYFVPYTLMKRKLQMLWRNEYALQSNATLDDKYVHSFYAAQ